MIVKNYVKCLRSEFTLPHGDISIFCIVSVKAACCYFFFFFHCKKVLSNLKVKIKGKLYIRKVNAID